jgi:hypothetical protein
VGRAYNIGFTINTLRRAIILLSKIGDIKEEVIGLKYIKNGHTYNVRWW